MAKVLNRLQVPSIEELAGAVIDDYLQQRGPVLDLKNPEHVSALTRLIDSRLRGSQMELQAAAEKACSQALQHVWALMSDPDYQANRQRSRRERMRRQSAPLEMAEKYGLNPAKIREAASDARRKR
ncbi:MAG: hypothetical protein GC160_02995 [Acidobacteria bacterium]|nr:hypothetical protein [Acidobacteriota bacterium]